MTLRFLTAGESHGKALVAILDGFPAGLPVEEEDINRELARRQKGYGAGPRMKIEEDRIRILGGVMAGKTTGAPMSFLIDNLDFEKWVNQEIAPFTTPRPGHADLTGAIKYGYNDLRPALERASARETAARVAVGAVCKLLLARFEIDVFGYVIGIGPVEANVKGIPIAERHRLAEDNEVRCPDINIVETMVSTIRSAIQNRDTLGGIIEVVSMGVPPGLGSYAQWDKRLEARLGAAVLSIPAIKGVEVGPAFENTRLLGSQVQDAICLDEDQIVRPTNRAGGLEGGITNGNPIVIRAAMKPIATTLTQQQTVDLAQGVEVQTQYQRSDFCPVPRAVPIVEASVAFVLADALLEKLGGDSVDEIQSRIKTLRQMRLQDLLMDDEPHRYWSS